MEELDFGQLLEVFKKDKFTRGEQVILANFGTNQTMLSIIFQEPNRLKLAHHREKDGEIARRVELYCGEYFVCLATSTIPEADNLPEVVQDVCSGTLGLGQIIVKHNLPSRRNLLEVGRNSHAFWRTYAIEGTSVYMKINEYFLREPFVKVGWDATF
jgi:chorismate-pyruvate lyase